MVGIGLEVFDVRVVPADSSFCCERRGDSDKYG
jgi:hypothetical protein